MMVNREYKISLTGKGAHGSRPDSGINPILCFSELMELLPILSDRKNMWVSSVTSGKAGNIIPERLEFVLVIRSDSEEEGEEAFSRFSSALKSTAAYHECGVAFGRA